MSTLATKSRFLFSSTLPRSGVCRLLSYRGNPDDMKRFLVLYKWPTMPHFRVISRFKVYQAGAMLLSLAPLSYWYSAGSISTYSLITGFSAATGTILVLCGLSYAFSKVLGELAYCERTKSIRLSHMDFLGRRRDLELDLKELVPFSDNNSPESKIQKLETLSNGKYLYSLKYGRVRDPQLLLSVLDKSGHVVNEVK